MSAKCSILSSRMDKKSINVVSELSYIYLFLNINYIGDKSIYQLNLKRDASYLIFQSRNFYFLNAQIVFQKHKFLQCPIFKAKYVTFVIPQSSVKHFLRYFEMPHILIKKQLFLLCAKFIST